MIAKTINIVIKGSNQGSELSEVMMLGNEYDFWVAIYANYTHNLRFLGLFYNFHMFFVIPHKNFENTKNTIVK